MDEKTEKLPAVLDPNPGALKVANLKQGEIELVQARPLPDQFKGMAMKPLPAKAQEVLLDPPSDGDVELRIDRLKSGKTVELLYVPHSKYRQRLSRAVGAGAWALHKDQEPKMDPQDGQVYWSGSLYILGQYIASAIGQQRYVPGNSRMSFADAVEGSKSDCLVRCCKDLGMFMELWTPSWRDGWYERNEERAAKQRKGGGGGASSMGAPRRKSDLPVDEVRCDVAELAPSKLVGKDNKRVYKATCIDEKQEQFAVSTFSSTIAKNLQHAHENGLKVKMEREGPNDYSEYRIKRLMLIDGPETATEGS